MSTTIGHSTEAPQQPAAAPDELQQLEQRQVATQRGRIITAGLYGGGIGAAFWAESQGRLDGRYGSAQPFWPAAQHLVNNVQEALTVTGGASIGLAVTAVAGVKIAALAKPRIAAIDSWSSRDMNGDRLHPKKTLMRRGLETAFAGRIPVMAGLGAALAVFSSVIGTEVSEGPERPIEHVMSTLTPGNEMIVNYADAMPMVQSNISNDLAKRAIALAAHRGFRASVFNLNLGQMRADGQTLSDLSIGIKAPAGSPIAFSGKLGCNSIPVLVDKSAGVSKGDTVNLNGNSAEVVGTVDGYSATNRIGVLMDNKAMQQCLEKSTEAPVHAVVIDAPAAEAQKILDEANVSHEAAALITKQHYLDNSKRFWDSNVKPITSVLALMGGLFAAAVSGAKIREGLIRNRREWAAKLGRRTGEGVLRATETLRVVKDGILASVLGGAASMFATPQIVNRLEPGFQATVGLKELLVGASVAITGSLLGAARSLLRPKKLIRTEESIRG